MIGGLKPYPAYKDSGIEWLGRVPYGWGFCRGKNLFRKIDRPVREGDEIVTCFRDGTVTLRRRRRTTGFTEAVQELGYQGVRRGDLVIHQMDAFAGAIGVSEADGKASPVYSVCVPRSDAIAGYYQYVVRQMAASGWIAALGKGVRERSTDFRFETFGQQLMPLPTVAEQISASRFLANADARIQEVAARKERLVELLRAEERAIVHHGVTSGFDSRARFEPSGVAWLGDLPGNWQIIPLRLRYSVRLGKMLDAKRITGASLLPYLRNTDVQWGRINAEGLPEMDISPDERDRYTVKPGDLLVCEGGEVGRAALWDRPEKVGYQKALHRLRPYDGGRDRPEFLYYVLRAMADLGLFKADGNENTIAHLTAEKLRRLRVPFPPTQEQEAIAKRLDGELKKRESAVATARSQIDLLSELRARLISDVVTGKFDVREAAANLPDDPDADDPALEEQLEEVAAG